MLALVLTCSIGMPAQESQDAVRMEPDYAEAKAEALRQGVPLLVFAVSRKEEAATLKLFARPWFIEASQDFFVVVAGPVEHEKARVRNPRAKGPRYLMACKVFRQVPCGSHREALVKLARGLRLPRAADRSVDLPQILLLAPDMSILSHWGKLPSEERMRSEMILVRRTLDLGFTEAQRKTLEKRFRQLRNRFMKSRSAKLKVVSNDLMAMPYPPARRFLLDVANGKVAGVRRPHRVTALEVLSMRGSYDALPPLIHALEDSDRRVREAGLEGLSEVRLRFAARPILEKSKNWSGQSSVGKIGLALIRSDSKGKSVRAWFAQILGHGRQFDRLAALDALLQLEDPDEEWIHLVEASAKPHSLKIQLKAARVLAAFESRK